MNLHLPEKIQPDEVYFYACQILPEADIDHHGLGTGMDDLYIRMSLRATYLIERLDNKSLLSTFVEEETGDRWYELPFCYPGKKGGENNVFGNE